MTNTGYIKKLSNAFLASGNREQAAGAKKYMRNQFDYFGIGTPDRRMIIRSFLLENGFPDDDKLEELIKHLWKKKEREFQYFGMEILEMRMKKKVPVRIELIEYLITHKSWWDTVDFIAPKLAGIFVKRSSRELRSLALRWMKSGNYWLMRSALLIQLKYKDDTDSELLFGLIRQCAGEKEFFIRKAIGWSLREYSKTNPELVRDFVNKTKLSYLSRKEALKRITE